MEKGKKTCVVAVGSTEFNTLVKALDKPEFYDLLAKHDFEQLVY